MTDPANVYKAICPTRGGDRSVEVKAAHADYEEIWEEIGGEPQRVEILHYHWEVVQCMGCDRIFFVEYDSIAGLSEKYSHPTVPFREEPKWLIKLGFRLPHETGWKARLQDF